MKKFNKSKKSTVRVLRPVLALLLAAMVAFPLSVVIAFTNSSGTDGQSGLDGHIIDTVSPAHVTFNLFDYWFTEQSAPTNDRGNGNWGNQMGINAGHPFIFWSPDSSNGDWNLWTGDWNHTFARPGYVNDDNVKYGEYKGIVEDVLGEDGYPVLNLGDRSGNSFITNNGLGGTLNESLAYLFDPDASNDYKASYENVQGLVKYNGKGGYIYNSHENFAEFKQQSNFVGVDGNESAGYFDVYESWALPAPTSPNGQFFPFDSADEVFRKNAGGSFETDEGGKLVSVGSKPASLNYFIGLTMETVFLQPKDGVIDEDRTPMSFTFSGDDDVWIFIDDVLVSDIGGVHDECFTVIDFQTGRVYTGLTPVKINESSSYEEEIPTIEKLREGESNPDMEWRWYDRDTGRSVDGTYAEFKRAMALQAARCTIYLTVPEGPAISRGLKEMARRSTTTLSMNSRCSILSVGRELQTSCLNSTCWLCPHQE